MEHSIKCIHAKLKKIVITMSLSGTANYLQKKEKTHTNGQYK